MNNQYSLGGGAKHKHTVFNKGSHGADVSTVKLCQILVQCCNDAAANTIYFVLSIYLDVRHGETIEYHAGKTSASTGFGRTRIRSQ